LSQSREASEEPDSDRTPLISPSQYYSTELIQQCVIPTHASSLKQDTHLSQRLNEEDRYVGEAEAEGYVLVKLTYAAPDSLRQKERSYTESSTSDDDGKCCIPHSVQFNVSTVSPESLHPVLSSLLQDIPEGECLEYVLCDYHGALGRVETIRHNATLYIPVTQVSDKTSKECFMAMLQHCEETKSAQFLVACIERSSSERPRLVRTLMFMGFKAVTFVKYPQIVPKNNKFIFMMYRIFNGPDLALEIQ